MRKIISFLALCLFISYSFPLLAEKEISEDGGSGGSGVSASFVRALDLEQRTFDSEGRKSCSETSSLDFIGDVLYFLEGIRFVNHVNVIADVPPEYGWLMYHTAKASPCTYESFYSGEDISPEEKLELITVDPYNLAGLLISEHSGPDTDFSLETSARRPYHFTYDPLSLGSSEERGLFQIKPRWVKKAGKYLSKEWTTDDLFIPEVNVQVAAFVVVNNKKSHRSCKQRPFNYHEHWIAHYKCSKEDRDIIDPDNFCRFKQKKFEKMIYSFTQINKPDLNAIGLAHNKRMEALHDKHQKAWKRQQDKKRKKILEKREELEGMTPEERVSYLEEEVEKLQKKVKKEEKSKKRREAREDKKRSGEESGD